MGLTALGRTLPQPCRPVIYRHDRASTVLGKTRKIGKKIFGHLASQKAADHATNEPSRGPESRSP